MTSLGRRAWQRGKTRADRRAQRCAVGGEGGRDVWRGAELKTSRGMGGLGKARPRVARADAEATTRRGRGLGPVRAWRRAARARLKRAGVPQFDHIFLKNFE
jgi:hypothetical protein